jgi:hypothetical protein
MVYRYRTIQLINTLININYVYYIQHGEVIPMKTVKSVSRIIILIRCKYSTCATKSVNCLWFTDPK